MTGQRTQPIAGIPPAPLAKTNQKQVLKTKKRERCTVGSTRWQVTRLQTARRLIFACRQKNRRYALVGTHWSVRTGRYALVGTSLADKALVGKITGR